MKRSRPYEYLHIHSITENKLTSFKHVRMKLILEYKGNVTSSRLIRCIRWDLIHSDDKFCSI